MPSPSARLRLRLSRAQERGVAAQTGGRRTPGSGNQDVKGDVQDEKWLGEMKMTVKTSRPLRLGEWRAVETQAFRACKEPYMVIELAGRKLAILSYETWLALRSGLP
jgi:hypothetical protein